MRKIMLVAERELRSAVQTRSFIVSIALMPLLLVLVFAIQKAAQDSDVSKPKTFAVVDRSEALSAPLLAAASRHNREQEARGDKRDQPNYQLAFVAPSSADRAGVEAQRLGIAEACRQGKYAGMLEIGADVLADEGAHEAESRRIRFETDRLFDVEFGRWASRAVNDAARAARFGRVGLSAEVVERLEKPLALDVRGPTTRDVKTGLIREGTGERQTATFLFPTIVVTVILMLLTFGTARALQSVVEEKQQRIAEVLVGCVTPFELMAGKLLGVVGVTLITLAVYSVGAHFAGQRVDLADIMTARLFAWLSVFVVLGALLYGSIALAVGAAASDLREAQALQMPATLAMVSPALLLQAVVRNPTGHTSIASSLIPFSAPMMMPGRLAMSADVPWWQPALAAAGVFATAVGCVWAAGRIFRIGLLASGRRVALRDLARWVRDGR